MNKDQILIVDDEQGIRSSLSGILSDEGYLVQSAESGEEAISKIRIDKPDLVILDIWLPGMDGLETLERLKEIDPDLGVIMISGHGTIETAVKATKLGAYDFIEKPLSLEKTLLVVRNALDHTRLSQENVALKRSLEQHYQMVGNSTALAALREQIAVAAPTNGRVLICGESGTGKELIARAIHNQSLRRDKPFVEVNCAAIPEDLIESELFGHERGAFTGATTRRRGKFELADGGTIFLDEIGDMTLKTQAKVLRVLEEQRFERVGGQESIMVDVRVLAASNKDLKREIQEGRFREDLYYRLNVIPFEVPPLRERHTDIPPLVKHFLTLFSHEYGRKEKKIFPEALELLLNYSWPGNVRELKNIIERLVIMVPHQEIKAADIPPPISTEQPVGAPVVSYEEIRAAEEKEETVASLPASLREAREHFEREFIVRCLREHNFNVTKTAQALGIERSNLHRKLKQYKVEGLKE